MKKNIVTDALLQSPNYGYKNTTHKSNYITENTLEIFDINELSEGKFLITFEIIDQYQRKDPSLIAKYKSA